MRLFAFLLTLYALHLHASFERKLVETYKAKVLALSSEIREGRDEDTNEHVCDYTFFYIALDDGEIYHSHEDSHLKIGEVVQVELISGFNAYIFANLKTATGNIIYCVRESPDIYYDSRESCEFTGISYLSNKSYTIHLNNGLNFKINEETANFFKNQRHRYVSLYTYPLKGANLYFLLVDNERFGPFDLV